MAAVVAEPPPVPPPGRPPPAAAPGEGTGSGDPRTFYYSRWARFPAPDQMTTKSEPAASGGQESARSGPARGPAWRALLEAQWRARLQDVTELSLAYHDAAAVTASAPTDRGGDRKLRQLQRRTATARRALAETDEALARLASGRYGLCEACAAVIPARLLAAVPDARYCPRCKLAVLVPPETGCWPSIG